jgi:hypothetical protein
MIGVCATLACTRGVRRGILKRLVRPAVRHLYNPVSVLEQCIRFTCLRGRRNAGIRLTAVEDDLLQLLKDFHRGDAHGQRAHCRFQTELAASIETSQRAFGGTVLNLGVGGLFIAATVTPVVGTPVRVRVGPYLLGATVRHLSRFQGQRGLGVQLLV